VEVGGVEPGAHRAHLDRRVPQLGREPAGEGVDEGLGRGVRVGQSERRQRSRGPDLVVGALVLDTILTGASGAGPSRLSGGGGMSATKLLVLGIVHLSGGAHGYQVRSELQGWGAEIWAKIKPGSIYHALKKAAADGLLTEHAEPGSSGPDRVLYRATARGRDEIVELVRDGLRRTHDPTMLDAAITMLPMLTRADAIAHVNERVARLEAELVEQATGWENPTP